MIYTSWEAWGVADCFSHVSSVLKNLKCLYVTQQYTRGNFTISRTIAHFEKEWWSGIESDRANVCGIVTLFQSGLLRLLWGDSDFFSYVEKYFQHLFWFYLLLLISTLLVTNYSFTFLIMKRNLNFVADGSKKQSRNYLCAHVLKY